jgi:hypothetical protein
MTSAASHQILGIAKADATAIPSDVRKNAFTTQAATATATASARWSCNPYLSAHPHVLCPVSSPTTNLTELCSLAFDRSSMSDGTTVMAMDSTHMPADGKLKFCTNVSDPSEACLPPGTVAIACGTDVNSGGVNVGGSEFSLTPSYIAVPKSEADLLMGYYAGCYAGDPNNSNKNSGYTKTTNFQIAYSNPNNALGRH